MLVASVNQGLHENTHAAIVVPNQRRPDASVRVVCASEDKWIIVAR